MARSIGCRLRSRMVRWFAATVFSELNSIDAYRLAWWKLMVKYFLRGGAVLAARRAHNPKVAGSNPAPATARSLSGFPVCGHSLNGSLRHKRQFANIVSHVASVPALAQRILSGMVPANPVEAPGWQDRRACAFVAQLAEHLPCKQDVVGSIPSGGSRSDAPPGEQTVQKQKWNWGVLLFFLLTKKANDSRESTGTSTLSSMVRAHAL